MNEMSRSGRVGECGIANDHAKAVITLLHPEEIGPCPFPISIESVLVHELLHIHMDSFARQTNAADALQDRAIEALVPALLKRGKG